MKLKFRIFVMYLFVGSWKKKKKSILKLYRAKTVMENNGTNSNFI